MNEIEKIKAKIKKLLALSKSPNPNEAASALKMAQELMAEYKVDVTDVNNIDIADEAASTSYRKNPPLYENILMKKIKRAFGCLIVYSMGKDKCAWRFIGLQHRVVIAAYIGQVLIRKLKSARAEYIKTLYRVRSKHRKTERADDFCLSWVFAVTDKLPEFAGVSKDEETAIERYFNKSITTTEYVTPIKRSFGNVNDRLNGMRAGENVQLQHGVGVHSSGPLLIEV